MKKNSALKNKKVVVSLSITAVVLILAIGYYIFWQSLANKMKNAVIYGMIEKFNKSTESFGFSTLSFDKVGVSGFPFKKDIIINNLTFSAKTSGQISKKIVIDSMKASSPVFGTSFDVTLENVKSLNVLTGESSIVIFDKEPEIEFSVYRDGRLRSLNYGDDGYIITKEGEKEISYASKNSFVNVTSERKKDKIDYKAVGSFAASDEIDLEENKDISSDMSAAPSGFSISFDVLATVFENVVDAKNEGKELEQFSITFNSFEFNNYALNSIFTIGGFVEKTAKDPLKFSGDLMVKITGFDEFINNVQEGATREFQNSEEDSKIKQQQIDISNNMFSEIRRVAALNPESKNDITALHFIRSQGEYDLRINGESLIEIFSNLAEKAQATAK